MQLYFDVRGQQEMGFFTEGIVMDYGLVYLLEATI